MVDGVADTDDPDDYDDYRDDNGNDEDVYVLLCFMVLVLMLSAPGYHSAFTGGFWDLGFVSTLLVLLVSASPGLHVISLFVLL